jgi:DNA-binding NarL/FixJ family response regulator
MQASSSGWLKYLWAEMHNAIARAKSTVSIEPAAEAVKDVLKSPLQNHTAKCSVYVYSEHPLARKAIVDALNSDRHLRRCVKTVPFRSLHSAADKERKVGIIDICSVENWTKLVSEWFADGSYAVALLPLDSSSLTEQLKVLYAGVRGIVTLSENLIKELPLAVHSVADGKLWISRSILDEYVRQTNFLLSRLPADDRRFTAREEQIVQFILRGFSNKQIGSLLRISERTVKFHITNILQKSNAENREGLLQKGLTVNTEAAARQDFSSPGSRIERRAQMRSSTCAAVRNQLTKGV